VAVEAVSFSLTLEHSQAALAVSVEVVLEQLYPITFQLLTQYRVLLTRVGAVVQGLQVTLQQPRWLVTEQDIEHLEAPVDRVLL
jgi:hypothetical protein